MKKNTNIVKSAKIINVISACIMALSGITLVLLPEMDQLMTAQRILLSALFGVIGGAKLLGYFSNDLYRLAFQFDFAIGIFCWILTLLIILAPARSVPMIPTLLAVYVVLDALLKIQISTDARGFGMSCWVGMIVSSGWLVCGQHPDRRLDLLAVAAGDLRRRPCADGGRTGKCLDYGLYRPRPCAEKAPFGTFWLGRGER